MASLYYLEDLRVNCHKFQSVLNIDTICLVGTTLRRLKMIDDYAHGDDPISVNDLAQIKEKCPSLEYLEVNLPMFPHHDIGGYPVRHKSEAPEFLKLLTQFESLTELHLEAEHSLGTENPRDSTSTDTDYDDAERIMKSLHSEKAGKPFGTISITLGRAFRPRNWRSPQLPEKNGHVELKNHWCSIRRFRSKINKAGEYEQWVTYGEGRVGEISESDEDRAAADEEYEKYLDRIGDGEKRRVRPMFSPGMSVMYRVPA